MDRAVGFKPESGEVSKDFLAEAMERDVRAIVERADAIALLPGWEASRGAHLELHLAHRLGLRVTTVEALMREAG